MLERLRTLFAGRPWWMNATFVFCLFMTFVYMPFDFFGKPVAEDQEIWFGVTLHGVYAKATEPLHWAIYAAGAYGFWKMRRWMHPWAALYIAQVALGMIVWAVLAADVPALGGVPPLLVFGALAWATWRARPLFTS